MAGLKSRIEKMEKATGANDKGDWRKYMKDARMWAGNPDDEEEVIAMAKTLSKVTLSEIARRLQEKYGNEPYYEEVGD